MVSNEAMLSARRRVFLAIIGGAMMLANLRAQVKPEVFPTVEQITAAIGSDADARAVVSLVLIDLARRDSEELFFLAGQIRPTWLPSVNRLAFVRLTVAEAAALIGKCGHYWLVSQIERRAEVVSLWLSQKCGGTSRGYIASF